MDPTNPTLATTSQQLADPPAIPDRVLLIPWGRVHSTNGEFVVDAASAAAALECFDTHATDLPIDYEHQTLGGRYSSPSGQAPAAGWIKGLDVVAGVGVFGQVEWTPAARGRLAAREYRYLSPVVIVDRDDRRLIALHSVGLTNKPAIAGARPLVNNTRCNKETDPMDPSTQTLRERLGLDAEADDRQVLLAAAERIDQLDASLARLDAERRVDAVVAAGKLLPAQRDWAIELVCKDPAAFEAWEATAPVVVTPGAIPPPDDAQLGDRRRAAVIAKARSEYRGCQTLGGLCDERAYVDDALRDEGLERLGPDEQAPRT